MNCAGESGATTPVRGRRWVLVPPSGVGTNATCELRLDRSGKRRSSDVGSFQRVRNGSDQLARTSDRGLCRQLGVERNLTHLRAGLDGVFVGDGIANGLRLFACGVSHA